MNRFGRLSTPMQRVHLDDQIQAVLRDAARALTSREIADAVGNVTITERTGCDSRHASTVVDCTPVGVFLDVGWQVAIHVKRRPARPSDIASALARMERAHAVLRTPTRYRCNLWSLHRDT